MVTEQVVVDAYLLSSEGPSADAFAIDHRGINRERYLLEQRDIFAGSSHRFQDAGFRFG